MAYIFVESAGKVWPAPRFEEIGGLRTAVYEAGSGPAVVLFHGCSLCVDARLTWFRLLPSLARTYRVIAYDQPGFGLSDMSPSGTLPDRMARTAHARELLRALDVEHCSAVGHSEGGFIATRLAVEEPSPVGALVICASGAVAPALSGEADAAWRAAAAKAYDYASRSTDEDRLVRTEERLQNYSDPDFEALLRENYRRDLATGHVDIFRARGRALGDYSSYTSVQEQELHPLLHRLCAPVLLLWGGADATVPTARGEALARRIRHAEFRVLESAGHWLMHDASENFAAAVMAHLGRDCDQA
jgi:pimeloyl-ACP methyl ester carboxylesterase